MPSTPSFETVSCDQVRWHPHGTQFATSDGPDIAAHTPNHEELWRLTLDVPADDCWELARLSYSPTGRWLAIDAGSDGLPWREDQPTLTIVDAATGAVAAQLPKTQGSFDCLSWHPDDNLLAVSSLTGQVLLVDLATGDIRSLMETTGLPHATAWHPDGTRLVISESNKTNNDEDRNTLHLVDTTGHALWQATGFDSTAWLLTWNHDGTLLASGHDDTSVRLWDPTTGHLKHTLNLPESGFIRQAFWVQWLAFSRDSSRLLVVTSDSFATLWDTTTAEPLSSHQAAEWMGEGRVFFNRDETSLISQDDEAVRGIDPTSGKAQWRITAPDETWIIDVDAHPTTGHLLVGVNELEPDP